MMGGGMDRDRLRLLGEILVNSGCCTRDQVLEARRRQLSATRKQLIGEILLEMGAVVKDHVLEARRRQGAAMVDCP